MTYDELVDLLEDCTNEHAEALATSHLRPRVIARVDGFGDREFVMTGFFDDGTVDLYDDNNSLYGIRPEQVVSAEIEWR